MPHASIMITTPTMGDFVLAQGGPRYPYPQLPPKDVSRTPLPRNLKTLRLDGTSPLKSLRPRPASRRGRKGRRRTATTKTEERILVRGGKRREEEEEEEEEDEEEGEEAEEDADEGGGGGDGGRGGRTAREGKEGQEGWWKVR